MPLIATLDPLTPALALAVELAAAAVLRPAPTARSPGAPGRSLLSAGGIVLTMVFFAADRTGRLLVALGPFDVTTGVLVDALGLVLRLFAVALPGVIVFATTDPTDLADALVQNARAPARFAIGALAAFRLLPLLGAEWQMLTLARRARGVDAGRNPIARIRLFASTAFALLVGALRRGGPAGRRDGRPRLRLGYSPHLRPAAGVHRGRRRPAGGRGPALGRRTHHDGHPRPVPPDHRLTQTAGRVAESGARR